jgi:hypothetical protein
MLTSTELAKIRKIIDGLTESERDNYSLDLLGEYHDKLVEYGKDDEQTKLSFERYSFVGTVRREAKKNGKR